MEENAKYPDFMLTCIALLGGGYFWCGGSFCCGSWVGFDGCIGGSANWGRHVCRVVLNCFHHLAFISVSALRS